MEPILEKFLTATTPYRGVIKEIRLFGSRARGSERPDSDYDLLLLVTKKDRKMIDALYDEVVSCLIEFGRLISLKIFTVKEWDHFRELKTPFSQAVTQEGIPLG